MTASLMNSHLAGESVVEEGSVNGFVKIILELEDMIVVSLLLLWALSVSRFQTTCE